jgi:hypothetical protein
MDLWFLRFQCHKYIWPGNLLLILIVVVSLSLLFKILSVLHCNAFCVSYVVVTVTVRLFFPVRWLVQRYHCAFVLYYNWCFSKVSSMYLERKLFESSPGYCISCLSTFITLYCLSTKMLRLYVEITTNSFKIQISSYVPSTATFLHSLLHYALHIKLCRINTLGV